MPQSPPATLPDRRFLLLGIPVLSAAITAFTLPSATFSTWPEVGLYWLVSLYFTTGYWLSNRLLWQRLLVRFPSPEQTPRRLWTLAALAVLVTAAATVLLGLPLHLLLPAYFSMGPEVLLREIRFSLVPTVAVLSVYESAYFFQQWKAYLQRAEQLARASTQAQLDALQSQLDPHFLFNSLNTLAALIEPTNDDAQRYLENLADVYRYVLLSREHPTVPLAEELAFVETYVALQRVRFRDNLQVTYDIAPAARARHVAPLSLQLLVENALKHNEASRARPLHLGIAADAHALRVANNLQPRTTGLAPHTGTGLDNVRRRYALLDAPEPVEVQAADGTFAVRLPLLPAPTAAPAA